MGPALKETYKTLIFIDEHDHEDDVNKLFPDENKEDDESDE